MSAEDILTITTTIESKEHQYKIISENFMTDRHKELSDFLDKHHKLFEQAIEWDLDNMVHSNGCGNHSIRKDCSELVHFQPFRVCSRLHSGAMETVEFSIVLNTDGSEHPSTVKRIIV